MSTERFCLIPEAGLNIAPNGDITPCCIANEYKLGNIATDSLSSIFYGEEYSKFRQAHREGNLPEVCLNHCIRNRKDFVHVEGRNHVVKIAELKKNKVPGKEKLVMLDIGLGNVCNLTCTFCNETWSSSWAKLKNKPSNIFYFDLETTVNVAKDLKDLVFISFKGGEPLNIPYLDKFLEQLYSSLVSKECLITMISNCTETNEKINNALFKFKVSMGVSVEATGTLYQYLRGGKYTWDNVVENLARFSQLGCDEIHVSSLLLLYNYTTWAQDMLKVQNDLKALNYRVSLSAQLCTHPEEQSIFLLNQEQRQRLVNSINLAVSQGLDIIGLEPMINNILAGRPVNTTKDKVLNAIKQNNAMRNMDLFSIVEDFSPYLDL